MSNGGVFEENGGVANVGAGRKARSASPAGYNKKERRGTRVPPHMSNGGVFEENGRVANVGAGRKARSASPAGYNKWKAEGRPLKATFLLRK